MNVRMWLHPSTQQNLAALKAQGIRFVGPNDGEMACGEFGPGRMAEPNEIASAVAAILGGKSAGLLAGLKALVTAGPTHEPIDPVRFLANRSSGKQGYAIAEALSDAGAQTVLVSGPTELAAPSRVKLIKVETAREMMAACEASLPVDIAVCTAAVADWRPDPAANAKLKKREDGSVPALKLVENPDILSTLAHHKNKRPSLVIGFAAETDDIEANAREKLARKGCDWILANNVGAGTNVMGGDRNRVHLLTREGEESWPELSKLEVARRLAKRIATAVGKHAA
jgi:phosphopantothenoylcysteine decarboxylase/phosphopantothenate--cysteine ligase